MKKETLIAKIRELVASQYYGVMSTQSEAFPLGSLVRYCLDSYGQPVFLLSRIAEHSKNLQSSKKAGLFILEREKNQLKSIQECARINLQGFVEAIDKTHAEHEECLQCYFSYFPETRNYFETLDFDLFRFQVVQSHFVGGFAAAHKISGDDFRRANPLSFRERQAIIEHMNEDHSDAIIHYCQKRNINLGEEQPEICAMDSSGFQVRVGNHIERIAFESAVSDRTSARDAFVAMAKN